MPHQKELAEIKLKAAQESQNDNSAQNQKDLAQKLTKALEDLSQKDQDIAKVKAESQELVVKEIEKLDKTKKQEITDLKKGFDEELKKINSKLDQQSESISIDAQVLLTNEKAALQKIIADKDLEIAGLKVDHQQAITQKVEEVAATLKADAQAA